MTLPEWVLPVLQVATGVVLVPLVKVLMELRDMVREHKQELYGRTGTNGLKGRVAQLADRTHDQGNTLQDHEGRLDLHQHRLDTLERRNA